MNRQQSGHLRKLLAAVRETTAYCLNPEGCLRQILRHILDAAEADTCLCYVRAPGSQILKLVDVLANDPKQTFQPRVRPGEGLIGQTATSGVPTTWAKCQDDPSSPEFYHSLGVPIRRGGEVCGVLVIQHRDEHPYQCEEVEIIETVAMVVAGLVVPERITSRNDTAGSAALVYDHVDGVVLSPGLGMGLAVLHHPTPAPVRQDKGIPEREIQRLQQALAGLDRSIERMMTQSEWITRESQGILEGYRMISGDRSWLEQVYESIHHGFGAEAALMRVHSDFKSRMDNIGGELSRESLLNFEQLIQRLLQQLAGAPAFSSRDLPDQVILVARSLGIADLFDYDRRKLQGILLAEGAPNGHVAIVARTFELPVIGQAGDLIGRICPRDTLLLDGSQGRVLICPEREVCDSFAERIHAAQRDKELHDRLRQQPARTADGTPISLQLNCGLPEDLHDLSTSGADGIGLFRTEIPFMVRSSYPDVGSQTRLYNEILTLAGNSPVVFRTLDTGGDKRLPAFLPTPEQNPMLGWRAMRVGLDRPIILRYQLRALIRAAASRPLRVMFPMISEVAELDFARQILDKELELAESRRQTMPTSIHIGVVLEVPALFWQLPDLLARVDFVSVGSNDLLQYLYACDRSHPQLAKRYDPLSPALLSALRQLIEACSRARVPITICGEMAGNPVDAMALVGVGFRSLSMSRSAIGRVKRVLRGVDLAQLRAYLDQLCAVGGRDLRSRMELFARDHGLYLH